MTMPEPSVTSAPGRRKQLATRIVFFIAGFGLAAWAPLVPFVQQRLALDAGQLGLLLLCLGVGSLVAMPLAGPLTARFGCRGVIAFCSVTIALALPALAAVGEPMRLALALFVFGAGMGCLDCAMNIQAIIVERASGRAMMSGFHGLFSVGGIAGAGGVSLLLGLGASPLGATGVVAVLILAALAFAYRQCLAAGDEASGPVFARPRGVVLLLGALCFILFLAEGAMLDWSAVFLATIGGVPAAQAGLGYAAFALAMTVGRLTGDRVVARLGHRRVVVAGALCAGAGFALTTVFPGWPMVLLGCLMIGAGCANIVPVLYTAVGRQTAMPENLAVSAVTTLGYAGILIGPAGIGWLAQQTDLATSFLVLAALLLGVAAVGLRLRF